MKDSEAWEAYDRIITEAAEKCANADAADRRISSLLRSEPGVWEIVRDGLARSTYMAHWCKRRAGGRKRAMAAGIADIAPGQTMDSLAAIAGMGRTFKNVMAQYLYGQRIGSMTADDCLAIAERCDHEASGHQRNAVWLRAVAARLKPGKTVEQSLTAKQLIELQRGQAAE